MKRLALAISLAILVLAPFSASATDYYACDCQTDSDPDCAGNEGSDAAAGTSAGTAWQTLEALRDQFDATTSGGDNFYFCSGGSFLITVSGSWEGNCEGGTACEFDEYAPTWGTSDEAEPIILGNGFAPFIFDNDGSNDVRGNVNISNLDIRGNRDENANGVGSGAPIRNITIDSVRIKGFRNGVQVIVGNDDVTSCTAYTDEGDGTSDLTCASHGLSPGDPIFLDGNFRDFALQGLTTTVTSVVDVNTITVTADPTGGASLAFDVIECGAGGNCRNQGWTITNSELYENARKAIGGNYLGLTVQNNNIHHNGGSDIGTPADRDHGMYVGGSSLLIENNDFWSNVGDPWSVNNGGANPDNPDGECSGSIVNVNGTTEFGIMDDIVIRGNNIWELAGTAGGSCWGIAVEAGSSSREEYTNVTIEKNNIWNVGRRGISAGSIPVGGVVQNNQIGWGGITPGFSVNGIWLAGKGGIDADDALAADVIIRNNSVYADANVTDTLSLIRVNDDVSDEEGADGWIVTNNAAMQDGAGDLNCLVFGGVEGDFTTVSNNACEENGAGSLDWVVGVVAAITDHATSASCVADPNHTWCGGDQTSFAFEDTTFPDFVLRPATLGDNLVDGGTGSAPADDINGKTRSTLDIGAYEYIATSNAYWIGGGGDWNDSANWSTSSGGGAAGGVPDADSVAIVDGSSGTGTITLNVDALVRDLDMASASSITALAFGAFELRCERDCTINDAIAITATSGTGILSVGRNLDTVGLDLSGVDNISINLFGPGFWEYDPTNTTDHDIDDFTVAQHGYTTSLNQNGPATVGSSDINIFGQWFLGNGYLTYDLTQETGSDDVPIIEFQNGNEDFQMMFEGGTIPDIEVEWEQTTGDRSVISHRAVWDGTTLDVKGASSGTPGAGHEFWLDGDIDLLGGIFWLNKLSTFRQRGYSLTAATARISFNNGVPNDWFVDGGTVTLSGEFRVSDTGGRSVLDLGIGGTFTAGNARIQGEPLWLSGGANSVFELTTATPGTCSTHRYVDPDVAGPGAGSIGDPWDDWTNVEANLTAATDCVYLDKATTLSITGSDLIGAGTGGILGAYGVGASPILSLGAERFDIDNDLYLYELRIEFSATPPPDPPSGGGLSTFRSFRPRTLRPNNL